ncbi:MAG: chemotaxis protein CheW [bacterium]
MSEKDKTAESVELLVEDAEEQQENKYLLCKLANEVYGINIRDVTDIIELQKITEVPDMPDYVKGVINLRGQVIPVIDLRLRFGMQPREYDDRTVITVVNVRDNSVGFIVDTATEVEDIPDKNIDPAPKFQNQSQGQTTEPQKKYISGLGKIGDQVTILLDTEKLVSEAELQL